ncbi:MAG: ABC transporter ATP-binding protein [Candidatus Latescibacteria bacterium]|nr:ABC transporter ATP-binding protein [Candidatus Latescibacterota bacterium]
MITEEVDGLEANLEQEVPEAVLAGLVDQLAPDDEIRLSVPTDITFEGTYGDGWLLATDRHLLTYSPNGTGHPKTTCIPLSDLIQVEIRDKFGSGALKVRTKDDGATVALFSKSLMPTFVKVPERIEALIRQARPVGEDEEIVKNPSAQGESTKRRCGKCGRVVHRRMGVCQACLDKRRLLFRLLSYAVPHWGMVTGCLLLLLTATFIGLTPPLILRTLIDDVLAPALGRASREGGIPRPRTEVRSRGGTDRGAPVIPAGRGSKTQLALLVGLLLVVNVSRTGIRAFRTYLMSLLGQRITFGLRSQVYRHLQLLSLNFYHERETGRIMAHVTHDVGRLQDFISDSLQEAVRDVATLLIICIILFALNASLAALILLPVPLIILFTLRFGEWLHDIYHRLWRQTAAISALLADTIPGVRVVKAFAQERREVVKFERKSIDVLRGELRVARLRSLFAPTMMLLTSISTLLIWWVGGNKVLGGTLTMGDFVAFTGYMWQFYGPVQSLCRLNHRFQHAVTSAERVFEVLDNIPDVPDKPKAMKMPPIEGRVEFRDVTFGYEESKPVLQDLSFTVEPGEMIGLAGHSGAGKSTLINLIARFYDVEQGEIAIDGIDVREVGIKSLRDQIGVVLQDPFLFNGTVAQNIAYGKPDATLDEVVASAKAANAHNFILGFDEGYDTIVGERGARVSGGERQRISIARAILRNPRILILDEATASVDTQTEAQIQEALERLVKGRTTFAIAHRLSTLKNAHRLLILEDGKLAEIGTHDELIAENGIYAKLCRMQTEMSKLRAV